MIIKPMRFFLIGFMGSGKTTVGKKLAEHLQLQFYDLDSQIEQNEFLSIEEIFFIKGEDYFRELEKTQLVNFLHQDHYVLSLGGGTPCFFDNMKLLNENGTTIYLRMSVQSIYERLSGLSKEEKTARPLIANKSKEELYEYIKNALSKREVYYLQSKIIVETDQLSPEKILHTILEKYENM